MLIATHFKLQACFGLQASLEDAWQAGCANSELGCMQELEGTQKQTIELKGRGQGMLTCKAGHLRHTVHAVLQTRHRKQEDNNKQRPLVLSSPVQLALLLAKEVA